VMLGGDGSERSSAHDCVLTGRTREIVAAKPSTEGAGISNCGAWGCIAGVIMRWNEHDAGV
jgi:hypothetical protein